MRSGFIATLTCILACALLATADDKPTTLADAATQAALKMSLTSEGVPSFHLQARISEPGEPNSDLVGSVDLLWVAPKKWRRVVVSPDFSQTAVMNGDSYQEENKGEYFPLWLRNIVLSITDPVTALTPLRPMLAPIPFESRSAKGCSQLQSKVGTDPVANRVFTTICFTNDVMLESIGSPGFHSEFKNYKIFAGKHVARQISEYLEPGVTILAEVISLEPLASVDEAAFLVTNAIPLGGRLNGFRINENTARQLTKTAPDIDWPPVRGGKTSGVLSIYVVTDRDGHVRETYPLNSDNPALDNAVREQVSKWEFKRATSNGVPVQIETILTFAFGTTIENPPAILTDAEARKRAIEAPEPVFPAGLAPSGTQFTVRVSVDEQGRVAGTESPKGLSFALGMAANAALEKWRFKSFLRNGKPDIFKADLVFRVP